jgi:hypothetical protein
MLPRQREAIEIIQSTGPAGPVFVSCLLELLLPCRRIEDHRHFASFFPLLRLQDSHRPHAIVASGIAVYQ